MKTFILLFAIIAVAVGQGIGDRLVRTALLYNELPLTVDNATQNGWTNFTDCDPNLGTGYTSSGLFY